MNIYLAYALDIVPKYVLTFEQKFMAIELIRRSVVHYAISWIASQNGAFVVFEGNPGCNVEQVKGTLSDVGFKKVEYLGFIAMMLFRRIITNRLNHRLRR